MLGRHDPDGKRQAEEIATSNRVEAGLAAYPAPFVLQRAADLSMSMRSNYVLQLQRRYGNRYVERMLASATNTPIQREVIPEMQLAPRVRAYSGTPATIFRSESVHPEEQHCQDVSEDSAATCNPIIDCINELIELLAGRISDIENKGGDQGHSERLEIVQEILRTLMNKALLECKNGEYDEELKEEAEKWTKRKPGQAPNQPEPEPSLREKIANALQKAGVPPWAVAGLVVFIIAALADPEPFTKVAAIIGAAAAIAFFALIGRSGDVPSTVASANPPATGEPKQSAAA